MARPVTRTGATEIRPKAERILETAARVFAERGYHRATIDEIIQRAGTGKGTVYNYFPSKERLFLAVIESREEVLRASLRQAAASAAAVRGRVEAVARAYLKFFADHADLWKVLIHEFNQAHPEVRVERRRRARARHQEITALIEALLEEGLARGEVRLPASAGGVPALARVFYAALFGVMVLGERSEDAERLVPPLIALVFEGAGG